MADKNKDAIELLKSIRNTLADVKDKTKGGDSLPLLVTRRRLLVVSIIANTIITNIDSLLEQEDQFADND